MAYPCRLLVLVIIVPQIEPFAIIDFIFVMEPLLILRSSLSHRLLGNIGSSHPQVALFQFDFGELMSVRLCAHQVNPERILGVEALPDTLHDGAIRVAGSAYALLDPTNVSSVSCARVSSKIADSSSSRSSLLAFEQQHELEYRSRYILEEK